MSSSSMISDRGDTSVEDVSDSVTFVHPTVQPKSSRKSSRAYIPMDALHGSESEDSDSVHLEVGEVSRAIYKHLAAEDSDRQQLLDSNTLALYEDDMKMRPKVHRVVNQFYALHYWSTFKIGILVKDILRTLIYVQLSDWVYKMPTSLKERIFDIRSLIKPSPGYVSKV